MGNRPLDGFAFFIIIDSLTLGAELLQNLTLFLSEDFTDIGANDFLGVQSRHLVDRIENESVWF